VAHDNIRWPYFLAIVCLVQTISNTHNSPFQVQTGIQTFGFCKGNLKRWKRKKKT